MNNRKQKQINASIKLYKKLEQHELSISEDLRSKPDLKRYIANIRKLELMSV